MKVYLKVCRFYPMMSITKTTHLLVGFSTVLSCVKMVMISYIQLLNNSLKLSHFHKLLLNYLHQVMCVNLKVISLLWKNRKHTSKLLSIDPRLLCHSVGVDLSKSLNSANQNRDLYTKFKEHLVSDGTIKWRLHTQELDMSVLSYINPTTGLIVPSSFVHVTSTSNRGNSLLLYTPMGINWEICQHMKVLGIVKRITMMIILK